MKLVDTETGEEFEAFKQNHAINGYGDALDSAYCLRPTGKVLEVVNGFANFEASLNWNHDFTKDYQGQDHKAVLLLEKTK